MENAGQSDGGAVVAPKRKSVPKKLLVLGLVVVLLAVGAGVFFYLKDSSSKDTTYTVVCTDAILTKAKPALNYTNPDMTVLGAVAKEIEAKPGYDQDPNCLYVVFLYRLNISDTQKAVDLYDKLAKAYPPKQGYSAKIKADAQTPVQLKSVVALQRQLLENRGTPIRGELNGGYTR